MFLPPLSGGLVRYAQSISGTRASAAGPTSHSCFDKDGKPIANSWQGIFPVYNTDEDGYAGPAPVGCFPPNGYGLYDMAGNVWEWTTDWYQEHGKIPKSCCTLDNPRGGTPNDSVDARDARIPIPRRVMKGGSFLCAPNYCRRYRPAARFPEPVDTSTCHVGFRCVVRVKPESA